MNKEQKARRAKALDLRQRRARKVRNKARRAADLAAETERLRLAEERRLRDVPVGLEAAAW